MIKPIFTTLILPIILAVTAWFAIALAMAMGLDALEYEQTGTCKDCLVLPHLSERLR